MKKVSDLVQKFRPILNRTENTRLVYFEIIGGISLKLISPCVENEMRCGRCGYDVGYVCFNDPKIDFKLCWFCSKQDCIRDSVEKSKVQNKTDWIYEMSKINPNDFKPLIQNDKIIDLNKHWQD